MSHQGSLPSRWNRVSLEKLTAQIATRSVEDISIEMAPEERALYDAMQDFIATTYNQASQEKRTAVGFVMTIYRRRLTSFFETLQKHLAKLDAKKTKLTIFEMFWQNTETHNVFSATQVAAENAMLRITGLVFPEKKQNARRAQFPVLRRPHQLRHALEPHAGGTAYRTHRSSGAKICHHPDLQPPLQRHGRNRHLLYLKRSHPYVYNLCGEIAANFSQTATNNG